MTTALMFTKDNSRATVVIAADGLKALESREILLAGASRFRVALFRGPAASATVERLATAFDGGAVIALEMSEEDLDDVSLGRIVTYPMSEAERADCRTPIEVEVVLGDPAELVREAKRNGVPVRWL